ncbi:MAG: hypothetical protein U1E64_02140 [Sphingomonadaceae bacterium]
MPLGFSSLGRSLEEVPLPPVLAVLFGAVAAILVVATPEWMFDRMVLASGLPALSPSIAPPFGEVARIIAAIAALWLVAGILWPAFSLVGALLAPKPQKGKGFRIEASFDAPAPALQLEALIRSSANSGPSLHHAAEAPAEPAVTRIKAVVRRAAHSAEMTEAAGAVAVKAKIDPSDIGTDVAKTSDDEMARDGVASRTIEPRKYKARKHHALPGKTLGSSETRH